MHFVGFTVEIYHDARPYQRQIFRNVGNERDVTSQRNLILSNRLTEVENSSWQLHIIAASETTRHR